MLRTATPPFDDAEMHSRSASPARRESVQDTSGKNGTASSTARVVIISGLSRNIIEAHLQQIFANYGDIKKVDIPLHHKSRQNKGKAAIEYLEAESASVAASHMNGGQLDGTPVTVELSDLPLPRSPSPQRRRSPRRSPRRGDFGKPTNGYGRDGYGRRRSYSRSRSRSRIRRISRSRGPPGRYSDGRGPTGRYSSPRGNRNSFATGRGRGRGGRMGGGRGYSRSRSRRLANRRRSPSYTRGGRKRSYSHSRSYSPYSRRSRSLSPRRSRSRSKRSYSRRSRSWSRSRSRSMSRSRSRSMSRSFSTGSSRRKHYKTELKKEHLSFLAKIISCRCPIC
ncbi:RNA-binding domain-containing protein [Serendipita vermifera]|nr:RNA-binding domain-containing protein [Serendipita vermifera]